MHFSSVVRRIGLSLFLRSHFSGVWITFLSLGRRITLSLFFRMELLKIMFRCTRSSDCCCGEQIKRIASRTPCWYYFWWVVAFVLELYVAGAAYGFGFTCSTVMEWIITFVTAAFRWGVDFYIVACGRALMLCCCLS